jgi:hypothetical protein
MPLFHQLTSQQFRVVFGLTRNRNHPVAHLPCLDRHLASSRGPRPQWRGRVELGGRGQREHFRKRSRCKKSDDRSTIRWTLLNRVCGRDLRHHPRYWWLVLRPDDIEVCLKLPAGREVDISIAVDLGTFTRVWLGSRGLAHAIESRQISLSGSARASMTVRRLLALPDEPRLKHFRFSAWPSTTAPAAQ